MTACTYQQATGASDVIRGRRPVAAQLSASGCEVVIMVFAVGLAARGRGPLGSAADRGREWRSAVRSRAKRPLACGGEPRRTATRIQPGRYCSPAASAGSLSAEGCRSAASRPRGATERADRGEPMLCPVRGQNGACGAIKRSKWGFERPERTGRPIPRGGGKPWKSQRGHSERPPAPGKCIVAGEQTPAVAGSTKAAPPR